MKCALLLVVAVAACAASDAEIMTAKQAVYQGDAGQLLQLAEQGALDENYKIAGVAETQLAFETVGRFYSPSGMLESEGADNYVKIDNHSVKVSFIVTLALVAPNQYAIAVRPRTWQYLAGSPQMRELAPNDPYLPPWVLGRADHLQVAIYNRTQGLAIAAPGAVAH